MTKEEIIHRLQYARYRIDNVTYAPDVLKAIDIAIEAVGNTDTDTISRQAVLALPIYNEKNLYGNIIREYVDIEDVKQLPPAQPQSMRKKWTYGEDEYGIDGYHCDKCGFFVPWDYTHKFIDFIKDYHFCPNCGAKMEVEHNG